MVDSVAPGGTSGLCANVETHATDIAAAKKAGLQAAGVAETLGEWPQAVNVYRRLEALLPQLHDLLEKKIDNAREHLTAPQK